MKKVRNISSFALSLFLIFTLLAGCVKHEDKGTVSENASTQDTQQAAEVKEPVEIRMMLKSHQTIDLNDPIVQEFQKRANVKLNIEIPPQANYTEKLQLLFASGEKMPDAVNIPSFNSNECIKAIDEELIVPITKYFNETKYLKDFVDPRSVTAMTKDGELWGIPRNTHYRARGFYVRQDWLKNVGIELGMEGHAIPVEKMVEICKAFTFNDPDGNKQNDTYGLSTSAPSNWDGIVPPAIQAAFDAGKGIMTDPNGDYTNSNLTYNWENFKRSIIFYKSMFDQKIVEPDILIANSEVMRDKWYKGKFGVVSNFGAVGSYVNFIGPMKQVDPDAELVWVNGLIGPEGKYKPYVGGSNEFDSTYITKDCKDPKVVIDMLDYMASPEGMLLLIGGLEGIHYELQDGIPRRVTDEQKKAYNDFKNWQYVMLLIRNYKNPDIFYETLDHPKSDDLQKWLKISATEIEFNKDLGFKPVSLSKLSDLDKEFTQVIIKYLVGDGSETELENMRNKYINSDGFKQSEKELNDFYKNK